MAITFFSGFEGGNTIEWTTLAGSAAVSTEQHHTGDYSLKCSPISSNGYVADVLYSGCKISFWLYIGTEPSLGCNILGDFATNRWNLFLTPSKTIDLRNHTIVGVTGTTVLPSGWNRISVSLDYTNKTAYYWINGNLEGNYTHSVTGYISGVLGIYTTDTAVLYFDDYVVDLDDATTDLGNIIVSKVANPNANGDTNAFDTPSGAGDHYTLYDDPAGGISDADYVMHAAKTVVQDIANLDSCTDIGLVGTDVIDAVNVCARMWLSKVNGGTTAIYVKDNGTGYASARTLTAAAAWYQKYYVTMPNDAAVWTQTRFNAFQAGGQSGGEAPDTYMSCVMVFAAYHAGAAGGYTQILYTSEPPTPNAWNQVKQTAGTGWKSLLYV